MFSIAMISNFFKHGFNKIFLVRASHGLRVSEGVFKDAISLWKGCSNEANMVDGCVQFLTFQCSKSGRATKAQLVEVNWFIMRYALESGSSRSS